MACPACSVPVLDASIPPARCHLAAFQGVPCCADADTLMCLYRPHDATGVSPLPEEALPSGITRHDIPEWYGEGEGVQTTQQKRVRCGPDA